MKNSHLAALSGSEVAITLVAFRYLLKLCKYKSTNMGSVEILQKYIALALQASQQAHDELFIQLVKQINKNESWYMHNHT